MAGLQELLSLWGKDVAACDVVKADRVYPWPDIEISDRTFIYLHSKRFDKFFRMSCSLSWTADRTIEYLVQTLALPWSKELPELGMRWSFSYGLLYSNETIPLSKELAQAGVAVGSVVQIRISGTYEDLFERERMEMSSKVYLMTAEMMEKIRKRDEAIADGLNLRGALTQARLKEIADQCFVDV